MFALVISNDSVPVFAIASLPGNCRIRVIANQTVELRKLRRRHRQRGDRGWIALFASIVPEFVLVEQNRADRFLAIQAADAESPAHWVVDVNCTSEVSTICWSC